ncbi:ABC transporter permease [uncultured Bartonella sp.]|uniref:ABC transporter permease n=1 Tax=uncultured Bartonella sp. TaxID=104108 RepID=UPI00262D0247|nr:ABC transporter permease [uncultured Bartonella sp.]
MSDHNDPRQKIIKKAAVVEHHIHEDVLTVFCEGCWNTHTVNLIDDEMRKLENAHCKSAILDASNIKTLDTAGAWVLERLYVKLRERNIPVELQGTKDSWHSLLVTVGKTFANKDDTLDEPKLPAYVRFFGTLGERVVNSYHDFLLAMDILGATIRGSQMKRGRGSGISIPAVVTQIDRMGVGAVPIIILMSFIVGAIIAQQGAFQLRLFGAEIFVVDLVGILVFRELGVLLTAIMIAGRSGSAITAEIGSMKMREETDALKVMGLNPIGVLVFPRLVALAVILPLLTVVSDISALVGAAVVADLYSNISYEAFITRLNDAVYTTTYFAGLIKAPFMALIIGIIASVEGLKVGGSAESLGQRVTSSVVKSIFVVIVIDGFFAVFYAAINF